MTSSIRIYIFSFLSFLAFSILANLLWAGIYHGMYIPLSYGILLCLCTYRIDKTAFASVFKIGFFSIILSTILLYYIKDWSWDGSTYHLEIIQNFIEGKTFLTKNTLSVWSHVYPKNMELLLSIFAAVDPFYLDFGRVVKGVLYSIAWIAIFDFLRGQSFSRNISFFWIIFLVFLHPLILVQFSTKYIDDMLYIWFIISVLCFLQKEYVLYVLIFCLFAWSKLNYALYAIMILPLLIYISCRQECISYRIFIINILRSLRNIHRWYLALFVSIWCIISGYIYIINILQYQNPFFPLIGSNKTEVVANNLPKNLIWMSKISAHSISLFWYSLSDISQNAEIIDITQSDFPKKLITSYRSIEVDTRIAWFGSIWWIIFLISLCQIPYIFYIRKDARIMILISMATLFAILILMPFAWARFIPFLYPIPLCIYYFLPSKIYKKIYLSVIATLFICNLILYIGSYQGRYYLVNGIHNALTEYYIKQHDIRIIWYYPGKWQIQKAARPSDTTQNEVYHLNYSIPIITHLPCSEKYIDMLFNIGLFHPLVIDCGNGNYLIRTRGYLYRDLLLGKRL